jgi:hypothetical protein
MNAPASQVRTNEQYLQLCSPCNVALALTSFATQFIHKSSGGDAGFFFGVRRSIQKWAYDEHNLFNTTDFFRNFGQEQVNSAAIVPPRGAALCPLGVLEVGLMLSLHSLCDPAL